MLNFVKSAFSDKSEQEIEQQEIVNASKEFYGQKSFNYFAWYEAEREKKQKFIQEKIVAEGFEKDEFLELLSKEKGMGPNIDFFTFDEIVKLADKFKELQQNKEENKEEDGDQERQKIIEEHANEMFEENLERVQRQTLAKQSTRRPTKKLEGTILNRHNNIVCQCSQATQYITNSVAGFVQTSMLSVEITTLPFNWKVKRFDTDFRALRNYLLRQFPQTIVPPLPRFNQKKKLLQKHLKKKASYYQRFLKFLMKSQILRGTDYLIEFLKEPNYEQFQVKTVGIEVDKGPKSIYDFQTLNGQIDILGRKRAKDFCGNIDIFISRFQEMNTYIAKRCKEVQIKSYELAEEYYSVGSEIKRLSHVIQQAKVPQLTMLYEKVSNLIIGQGDFVLHSGETMNSQLSSWFKYQREETQSFKEAKNLFQESKLTAEIRQKQLLKEKDKLFKAGDVTLWNTDNMTEAERVKHDSTRAFQYILPETTKEVERLKEETEYFTNQCYREIRRVCMDDYQEGREDFLQMGEMMLRFIYNMNVQYQEFLSFYTGINKERKKYDQRYQQENYIGEEIDEPIGNDTDEELEKNERQSQPVQKRSLLSEVNNESNSNQRSFTQNARRVNDLLLENDQEKNNQPSYLNENQVSEQPLLNEGMNQE